jgi:hypothetical protein
MVIKTEEHKRFLLELMAQVQYPGQLLDLAYEVKKEIESATVGTEKKVEGQ